MVSRTDEIGDELDRVLLMRNPKTFAQAAKRIIGLMNEDDYKRKFLRALDSELIESK